MTASFLCRRAFFYGTFSLSLLSGQAARADWLFDFEDLGTLGGEDSAALGLNGAGEVVGWAQDAKGAKTAFVWSGAGLQTVATPSSVMGASLASDISDTGDIVGLVEQAVAGGCSIRNDAGFLLSHGTSSVLLPGRGTRWPSISDNGIAATSIHEFGFNCLPSSGPAFRFQANTATPLHVLQDAFDVNDSGVLAGATTLSASGLLEAATSDGVSQQLLGTLCVQSQGSCASSAFGINNQGLVVGESATDHMSGSLAAVHAFVFRNQQLADLGTLAGFEDSRALAVDDFEDVVGSATRRSDGAQRALLFGTGTPIDLNTVTAGLNGFTLLAANDVRPIWTKVGNFPFPVLDGAYIVGQANKPGVGSHAYRLRSRVVPVNPIELNIEGPIYRDKPELPDSWYQIDIQLPEKLPCAGGLQVVMFNEKLREQVIEPSGLVGDRYPYFLVSAEQAGNPKGVQIEFRVRGKLTKSSLRTTQLFCRSPHADEIKIEARK